MISIIIPVYNTEKYLHRCIDSILAQTYTDFELILIDDGSTDSSRRICEEYAAADNRIRVFHQENKGQSIARNVGLDYVFEKNNSEWITFVDSDDYVSSRFLEVLLNAAINNRKGISICNTVFNSDALIDDKATSSKVIDTDDYYSAYMYSSVPWAKLFAKDMLYNRRFPDVRRNEDELFIYKVLFQCDSVVYSDSILYSYTLNPDGNIRGNRAVDRFTFFDAYREQLIFFHQTNKMKSFHSVSVLNLKLLKNHLSQNSINKEEKYRLRSYLRWFLDLYAKELDLSLIKTPEYYGLAYPIMSIITKPLCLVKRVMRKITKIWR